MNLEGEGQLSRFTVEKVIERRSGEQRVGSVKEKGDKVVRNDGFWIL